MLHGHYSREAEHHPHTLQHLHQGFLSSGCFVRVFPPNQRQQQVEFHEPPDSVPTIDQYQSHFLERSNYTVNNATQLANDTTVALSNDTFYTPKPSEECSIFKTITTLLPKVTTPNDKSSSAGTGENSGSSDKKSLFRRMPKLRARMAVVISSRPWEDYLTEEYDLVAARIYLPRQYSTWHSRIPREVRHRVTVGSGENASMMDILEWGSRIQVQYMNRQDYHPTMTSQTTLPRHMIVTPWTTR
jgi:hypothetical protein